MGHPSETHLKPKSRENSVTHDLFLSCLIVLKFYTEYGNDTAALCVKFKDDLAIKTDAMDDRDFARFELNVRFGRISYIAQPPDAYAGMYIFICSH